MSRIIREFDPNTPIPLIPVPAYAWELAQKLLGWIERTREEMEKGSETYAVDRLSVLVDDIETLCKEQLGDHSVITS